MALKERYANEVVFIVADLDNPQTDLFFEQFNILYIPDFYFIDADGVIAAREAGVLTYEEMAARIDLIVGDAPVEDKAISGIERFFSETLPAVIGQRTLIALTLVFLGGLLTSISPCIITMVPLLVGYIGGYGEGDKTKGFILSASFVIGMALTFSILGFIAAHFGRVFGEIGTAWYYLLVAVALIMGLQLLGVLTFKMPGLTKIPIKKTGFGGALVMGMLFGLVASPCATPVLAVIITYAAVQAEPLYGSSLLFIYGLGHGIPLLVAGTFTGLARNLPKINKYTHYLSYISGAILVIAGLFLLYWVGLI
ncbi:MAG: cytochrome c biogenesis protein CcdA [Bacillota bacterium]|nr:cytochrome c biogenesis protein CcdA [Bacillota bacterium]